MRSPTPHSELSAAKLVIDQGCFLSVIMPAYNEERRLANSLRKVIAYFSTQTYTSEIIVVDDGSTDRTAEIVEEFMQECPTLRLVRADHGGKGHACKQGVFASQGTWLFLCDTDLSMPIEEIAAFVQLFEGNYQIVIASRELPGSHRYGEPLYRHAMGRVFNLLVRALTVRNIQDTQCGFKCFRSDIARELFRKQSISGWGFDVEVLFIAQKWGCQIAEVPIDWYYQSSSKVRPVQDTLHMFREVWRIRLNDLRGRYKACTCPSS